MGTAPSLLNFLDEPARQAERRHQGHRLVRANAGLFRQLPPGGPGQRIKGTIALEEPLPDLHHVHTFQTGAQ